MFKELFTEAAGWRKTSSVRPNNNMGVTLLSFGDKRDYLEIARSSRKQFAISAVLNGGDTTTMAYDISSKEIISGKALLRYEDDLGSIPAVSEKELLNLDILRNKEEDWGNNYV